MRLFSKLGGGSSRAEKITFLELLQPTPLKDEGFFNPIG
jgi:hypothetical protein